MSAARTVLLELTTVEMVQLVSLVEQFAELIDDSSSSVASAPAAADPAVSRLTPDAYPDDAEAGADFRDLTRSELLARRTDDAGILRRTLRADGALPDASSLTPADAGTAHLLALDGEETMAWMRTLSALRLVLASRMGIEHDGDQPLGDPRYVVYEWLGERLEGLVEAATPAD